MLGPSALCVGPEDSRALHSLPVIDLSLSIIELFFLPVKPIISSRKLDGLQCQKCKNL